jgi:hypothetical protein
MCTIHHFWILALLHCYKYHMPITIRAYKLCVKLYVFNSYLGATLPMHANIFILKDTILCLHTQIHTHTHTYKHATQTCTNVSLVYYSQNNVMKYFHIIYCVEKHINFHGFQSFNIAWLHYFPLSLIFSLLLGANEIQWANMIILEKDCMSFFPKEFFSYEWILKQFFCNLL